jgi:hypothetical protein
VHGGLELAHVAGPAVAQEEVDDRRLDLLRRLPEVAADLLQEVLEEIGNVLAALAQRRQHDGDDVQAVVEVLAGTRRG